jgi:hypothetical protein
MKWSAITLAAILTAAVGQAAEPTLQDQAKALMAKPPSSDGVFRLKQDIGAEQFKLLNSEILRQAMHLPAALKSDERVSVSCGAIDPDGERLSALFSLAAATEDEAQWRARLEEAQGALKKRTALSEASKFAEDALRTSGAAADPWRAELARRVDRDQFVRTSTPDLSPPGGWFDGVSAPVRQYLNVLAFADWCAVDVDNTAWLKGEIARRGWPRISRDGKEADQQAWLLVQHADHDPTWQAQVLAKLAELAPKGETNPKNYAYLFDRVAMKRGGPQRYGTQGHCIAVGEWRPFDDEPGDLDARRASVGLPAEADYISGFKTRCFKADGV